MSMCKNNQKNGEKIEKITLFMQNWEDLADELDQINSFRSVRQFARRLRRGFLSLRRFQVPSHEILGGSRRRPV